MEEILERYVLLLFCFIHLVLSCLTIFQVIRTGGSGGIATLKSDNAFFEFLGRDMSATPMWSKAVKVIRKNVIMMSIIWVLRKKE